MNNLKPTNQQTKSNLYTIPTWSESGKGWVKLISNTNPTGRGGYKFEGEFLTASEKRPLEDGAIVLAVGTNYGNKLKQAAVDIYVARDGELRLEHIGRFKNAGYDGRSTGAFKEWADWTLDRVEQLLKQKD